MAIITIHGVNRIGLQEIRADLERFGKYPPALVDAFARAYAYDLEESLDGGGDASFEIAGINTKSGNPHVCTVSPEGIDKREVDV
ncbi:hypothetical protein [Pikeienuella sp. HZG-20]|uniref:hypothetical protein n=1 Tax=Paludibacillus litoralis TaxID=3133267 RepID=UPI0030EB39FD